MAKAYLMGHITVTNLEGYKKYSQVVSAPLTAPITMQFALARLLDPLAG